MTKPHMNTPVALLVFNRPDLTERVFAEVARARPSKLLVVADGPRTEAERVLCERTRAVVSRVDWDCEVLTDFAETNMGCKRRVSTGISWVFEQAEEAIILEDDCLPHPSFFRFCSELLERYRDDERVMMVSGDNFQLGRRRTPHSYYFSRHTHIWGWASWRRAWRHYDVGMEGWPGLREGPWLLDLHGDEAAARHWRDSFDHVHSGRLDTWDYQWAYACWSQNGLVVLPEVNLVTNIGWRADATHTRSEESVAAGLEALEMEFPLGHPPRMIREREADQFTFELLHRGEVAGGAGLYARLRGRLAAAVPPSVRRLLARRSARAEVKGGPPARPL